MPNPFAHIELTTDNLKAAQKFYSKVFAWKLSDVPGMNYTMINVGTGVGGGMQSKPMPEAPTGWMPYVQVDDVKATVAKATTAERRRCFRIKTSVTWARSGCSRIRTEP